MRPETEGTKDGAPKDFLVFLKKDLQKEGSCEIMIPKGEETACGFHQSHEALFARTGTRVWEP